MSNEGWGLEDQVDEVTEEAAEAEEQEEPEEPEKPEEPAQDADTADEEESVEPAEQAEEPADADEVDFEDLPFEDRLRRAIIDDDITKVVARDFSSGVEEIDDPELLEKGIEMDERKTALGPMEDRLDELQDETSDTDTSPTESDDAVDVGDEVEQEGEAEAGEEPADGDDASDGPSGRTVEEEADEVEPEPPDEPEVQDIDPSEIEDDAEVEEMLDDLSAEEEESEPDRADVDDTSPSETLIPEPPSPEDVDTTDIADDALTAQDAASVAHRWKILGWGPPGTWKTHFGFTMPEPVVFIDTEGKAHDIAHKFSDRVIRILQPESFEEVVGYMEGPDGSVTSLDNDEAARGTYRRGAVEKGIEILERFQEEQGVTGTIVVDSMSIMWEWAQQFYVDQWYDDASTPADVDFQSAMQDKDGPGDWKQIKNYHNAHFRDPLLATPFHLYWTAMSTEDYNAVMEEGLSTTPMKPYGETRNVYKVDQIIRARIGDNGPVGDLEKPGLTKEKYRGLPYPTFDKHRRVMQVLIEAERDGENVDVIEVDGVDVEVTQEVTSRG